MKLYFVRHGESVVNTKAIISNHDLVHPLTDKGWQQALALAQQLKRATITRIFSSPILRAEQTAEILAQGLGVRYEITDALREFDCGVAEGESYFDHVNDFERLFQDWRSGKSASCFEGGESLLDVRARVVPFVEQVTRMASSSDNIVLVSHGGTLSGALPFVLKNIDSAFAFSHLLNNTGVVVAESTPDGLMCRAWADQTFG